MNFREVVDPPEARASLSDDISELEPPDPIPNSVVKRLSADGSVGSPHVRVGHRQACIKEPRFVMDRGFLLGSLTGGLPYGLGG